MEKSQNIMKLIAGCDVIKFEIYLIFLIKPFFYMTKKSRQKLKYLRTKRAFYVKQKSFLKGFPLPRIVSDLRVRL